MYTYRSGCSSNWVDDDSTNQEMEKGHRTDSGKHKEFNVVCVEIELLTSSSGDVHWGDKNNRWDLGRKVWAPDRDVEVTKIYKRMKVVGLDAIP